MTITPDDLIDGPAAAMHLGMQPGTFRKWVQRLGVPTYGTERRRRLYSLSDLYRAKAGKHTESSRHAARGALT